MTNLGVVAADWHARMCNDPRFGYTQGSGRWGSSPVETGESNGLTGKFAVGDRDCSSSVIDVWREVLTNTPYKGALDAAIYTGNMRSVFTASGLFEWKPMSFTAQTGDIYLNEQQHTAMCQSAVPDMLSEFLINENGQIMGGQVGDQTGRESVVRAYGDFPWDGILHYNGKADIETRNDRAAIMWESTGGDNQRFKINKINGAYQFVCKLDGRALDVSGGKGVKGAEVVFWPAKKSNDSSIKNQLWKPVKKSGKLYELVSMLDENLCLDVVQGEAQHGAKLCIWERHNGTNQEWEILDNYDGTYSLLNNGYMKMFLDRSREID